MRASTYVALTLLPVAVQADAVDDYLRRQMSNDHIPGLAVVIVRKGKIVKLKCYGKANLEWGNPVTPDTVFQLASTTKNFTAVALMRMVEQGKIELDAPVTKYLPRAPASWRNVTIRHLATHTSGIPDVADPNADTIAKVVEAAGRLPLDHVPGERSGYASADFVVLAQIMAQVSGKPFQKLLEDLFQRLGMRDTRFDEAVQTGYLRISKVVPRRADVYRWDQGRQTLRDFLFPVHTYSAGGLYSSPRDLARWAIELDQGVLSSGAMRRMWTPYKLNDGTLTSWAIGWVARTYEGRRTVGHSGGPALSDFLRFPDDGLTIVVLQNQQRLYPYLAQGVADIYLPPRPSPAKPILDSMRPLSQTLRSFVANLGTGKLAQNSFAPGNDELVEDTKHLLVPYAQSLGSMQSFVLIERNTDRAIQTSVYATRYGKKVVRWIFDTDAKGKIVGIDVQTP